MDWSSINELDMNKTVNFVIIIYRIYLLKEKFSCQGYNNLDNLFIYREV
jgi:hypothetical protein